MTPPTTPYADGAPTYWERGWRGVIPLPERRKALPPRGYTGVGAEDPTWPDVYAWTEEQPTGNLALRMPIDVVGIDVDDYGDKVGARTLTDTTDRYGPLPPTWRSTARDDGVSGISFYRVPPGLAWPGELVRDGGVEIIQRRHRYAVVWPSIHPDTGTVYRWVTPDGAVALSTVPRPHDLAELPTAWIDGLTNGRQIEADTTKAVIDHASATGWARNVRGGTGTPCRRMRVIITEARAELAGAGSRHDAMNRAVGRLVRAADGGHSGFGTALGEVRDAFETAVGRGGTGQRDGDTARSEFGRGLTGAIALVVGDPDPDGRPENDPCTDPFSFVDRGPGPGPTQTVAPPLTTAPATSTAGATALADQPEPPRPPPPPPLQAPTTAGETPDGPVGFSDLLDDPTTNDPSPTTEPPPERPATAEPVEAAQPSTRPARASEGDTSIPDADAEVERAIQRAQAADVETERLRARRTAQRQLDDEEHARAFRTPPATRTLTDELAIADEPITYTVDQVFPTGANILLTAQYKAGKTTTMLNLIRSLVDGGPFLDHYNINAPTVGRVAVWNYEVSRDMFRRWMRDIDIRNTDAISVLNLRGFRMPMVVKRYEDWIVEWLREHEVSVWVVDPFARAAVGSVTNENDNTEVGAFLDTLDVIKDRAGVRDLIMPTHTGRGEVEEGQERARGATRLDDWADVRWLLTKDEQDVRYFRATGRDVETPETALRYKSITRELVTTGGDRHQNRTDRVDSEVMAMVNAEPGIGLADLRGKVRAGLGRCSNQRIDEAIERLSVRGRLRVAPGSGRRPARHHPASFGDLVDDS